MPNILLWSCNLRQDTQVSNMYYHVWVLYQSLYVPDFMQSVKLCEAYSINLSVLHVGELRP